MAGSRPLVRAGGTLGAAAALGLALAAGAASAAPPDPVELYFDGSDCGTDAIEVEVEVYDREAQHWKPHPVHPRVPVPSCQVEDAGILLNELRWRCAREGAPWRHVQVFGEEVWNRCEELRILEEERARIRDAQRKRLRLEAERGEDAPTRSGEGERRHGTTSRRGDD